MKAKEGRQIIPDSPWGDFGGLRPLVSRIPENGIKLAKRFGRNGSDTYFSKSDLVPPGGHGRTGYGGCEDAV